MKKNLQTDYRLKAPSILNVLSGILVLAFRNQSKKNSVVLPRKIGSYLLFSPIKKKDNSNSMAIGIYELSGKKVLVKRSEVGTSTKK